MFYNIYNENINSSELKSFLQELNYIGKQDHSFKIRLMQAKSSILSEIICFDAIRECNIHVYYLLILLTVPMLIYS